MPNLENRTITIKSLEGSESRYKIKDQNGLTYSFFTTKKDGSQTEAYRTFMVENNGGPLMIGNHVQVTFREEQKPNQSGQMITYRNIVSFLGGVTAPLPSPGGMSSGSRGPSPISDDRYSRRLAMHGMVNGLLAAGVPVDSVVQYLPGLSKLEDEIEASLILLPSSSQPLSEEVDQIVEDIPFN